MKKKQNLNLFIIPAVIVTGGIVFSTYLFTKDTVILSKSEAVQGCYEITSGVKKTDLEEFTLEETQINRETLEECLTLKGF